jgi:hypothetical protein
MLTILTFNCISKGILSSSTKKCFDFELVICKLFVIDLSKVDSFVIFVASYFNSHEMFCGLVILDPRHTFIWWVMQASWKCSWKFKRIKVLEIENQQGKFTGGGKWEDNFTLFWTSQDQCSQECEFFFFFLISLKFYLIHITNECHQSDFHLSQCGSVILQQINIVMNTYPPIEIEMKEPFYI